MQLTNDEGNHGGSIATRGFQALDQLLHLPNFNVLLGLVGLGVAHDGRFFSAEADDVVKERRKGEMRFPNTAV